MNICLRNLNTVLFAKTYIFSSHAHEEIPGTVNLRAVEGDDTAYGQALFPVPAEDPNDPLQVRTSDTKPIEWSREADDML